MTTPYAQLNKKNSINDTAEKLFSVLRQKLTGSLDI